MKLSIKMVLTIAIGIIFTLSSFTTNGRWELLGERKVNLGLDHDRIVVGMRDGVFSKLKIKVKHSGINMHKMVVHFKNGDKQEIAIREDIAQGGESRVIDLEGKKRVITEVDFWYDTKGLINNKAIVELWGRH